MTRPKNGGGTQSACGYEGFFGQPKVDPSGDGTGDYYWTLGVGTQHPLFFLSVNDGQCDANTGDVHLCNTSSQVYNFVKTTLGNTAVNPQQDCVVVYWHEPRWSWWGAASASGLQNIWAALFKPVNIGTGLPDIDLQPDLVLTGHSHNYQRYAPLNVNGQLDQTGGITEIIVGSGGEDHDKGFSNPQSPIPPVAADINDFGVLKLAYDTTAGTVTTSLIGEDGQQLDLPTTYMCHWHNVSRPGP
jgi:hypothetical protein